MVKKHSRCCPFKYDLRCFSLGKIWRLDTKKKCPRVYIKTQMPISAGGWFEEPEFRYCTAYRKLYHNTFLARTHSSSFGHSAHTNACGKKQGVHKPQMNLRFKEHTLFKPRSVAICSVMGGYRCRKSRDIVHIKRS
jgi:hypothetical protein